MVVRCSYIVSFFRKYSKAMYCLKEKQSALSLPTHALMQDVVTRWNSTFSMIERVCEQQAAICASLVEQKRLDLMPNDIDISIAESILEVLKPFKHISDAMCAEKCTTTSIKPLLHHFLNTVLTVKDSDLGAVKEMKKTMKHNLQTCYDSPEVDRLLSIACYLDIRFKEVPFMSSIERLNVQEEVRKEAMAVCRDHVQKEVEDPAGELAAPHCKKSKLSTNST